MLKRVMLLSLFPTSVLLAQNAPVAPAASTTIYREAQPWIAGTAMSNVKFTPDRATVRISVQTRATTASAAASQNATKQNAVFSALRALGLPNEQLSTADYSVNPEYRYEQNKSPVLVGYTVTNTILADVRDLTKLGRVLDSAISSGANLISSLDFYASNTDAARKQAIAAAVDKARSEADVAAKAAGGSIGGLVSLNIGGDNISPPPRPVMMRAMAEGAVADATPINPGEQTLTVSVSARWQFVASR